jgi:hypothetical protein
MPYTETKIWQHSYRSSLALDKTMTYFGYVKSQTIEPREPIFFKIKFGHVLTSATLSIFYITNLQASSKQITTQPVYEVHCVCAVLSIFPKIITNVT